MKDVIEKISEIQSMIEREVEWPLIDHYETSEVNPTLRQINAGLLQLQIMADQIKETT